MEPAARAGRMISAIDWARSANMRAISAAGAIGPRAASDFESSRTLRIRSPRAVPPGLRRVTTVWPSASRVAARRRSWVVFPEPSRPSKVMKYPRGITFSLPRASVYRGGIDGIQEDQERFPEGGVVMLTVAFIAIILALFALLGVFALMAKDQNRRGQSGSQNAAGSAKQGRASGPN